MTLSLRSTLAVATAVAALAAAAATIAVVHADGDRDRDDDAGFRPGNLVVSRSVYDNRAANVAVGTILPPGCATTSVGCGTPPAAATNDGTYPLVWNNDVVDGSFGITSRIFLDQLTPSGRFVSTLEVPNSLMRRGRRGAGQLVTSFSSKSELALHLSTDGRYLTFIGYVAPVDAIDISNANTPWPATVDPLNFTVDPTNPVGETAYRAVAQVDRHGRFHFTETNAYSGNNGRAAMLNNSHGSNVFYTAGNAGNGSNPQPNGVILGAGAQILTPTEAPEALQDPGVPTPVASFSVTELGDKADKVGKDDNFRGMAIFDDVLYFTKGSGGNGVDTVYFVDTSGSACPSGTGLPAAGAALPTMPIAFDQATLQTKGLPNTMCILAGFPTALAKTTTMFPFGVWFADAHTIYLADEGDGNLSGAAAQTNAGLQKWVFDSTAQKWHQAYTLQAGLNLGAPYVVPDYPTGNNPATGLPWAPATDGLRNLTGRVSRDGTVTIWAITSTVSGNGDQGADPNRLVAVTDRLDAQTLPASEQFVTLRTARAGEVLRGVEFAPR